MSLQAIISNVIQDPGAVVVEVTYTDNATQKFQKEYRFSSFDLNSFKRTVQSQIDQFSSIDPVSISVNLPLGPFDPTIAPPPPPPDPTDQDKARTQYAADLSLYRQMERAVALQVKKDTDQNVIDQLKKIQTNFIDSYIDLF